MRTFQPREAVPPASLEFVERDFRSLDLGSLPKELTSRQVIEARLTEIDRCLNASAPLAVIFLVGSTLEGLLLEVALAHPQRFMSDPAAPSIRGQTKQLATWTLAELIIVARSLTIVGVDVARFAEHVRDFRNYIHPRQQLREKFEPRMETAQIAQQVLFTALADLAKLEEGVDSHVGISDIGVVKSDVPSNAPPPRRRGPALAPTPGVAPLADARGRTRAELELDLEDTIRRGKAAIALTPGQDGTPEISSMIAVWVLTQVGKAIGTNKSPVKLSKVKNPEDLRSIGGVARLLHAVFHPAPAVAS